MNNRRQRGYIKIIIVALIVIISGAIYYHQKKEQERAAIEAKRAAQIETLQKLAYRWDDALNVAASTGRLALNGPVQELQRIRRETKDAEVPECLSVAKANLVAGMDAFIDGFLQFMQNDDAASSRKINEAKAEMSLFKLHAKDCVKPA